MEKIELSKEALEYLEKHKPLIVGEWSATSYNRTFKVNNKGIKLAAREDENLEWVLFDLNKKTVSVKVKNPTLPLNVPRVLDLSEAAEFFEELRKNIEMLLMTRGTFVSVTPNADRTVFEIA
ncbi:MAG: hypothetical protein J6X91_05465 [Bacteroidales bacterium]|nr:hypothetical protein [Bacteroidales bacterium]